MTRYIHLCEPVTPNQTKIQLNHFCFVARITPFPVLIWWLYNVIHWTYKCRSCCSRLIFEAGDTAHAILWLCACATDSKKAGAQKPIVGSCAAPGVTGPQPSWRRIAFPLPAPSLQRRNAPRNFASWTCSWTAGAWKLTPINLFRSLLYKPSKFSGLNVVKAEIWRWPQMQDVLCRKCQVFLNIW